MADKPTGHLNEAVHLQPGAYNYPTHNYLFNYAS